MRSTHGSTRTCVRTATTCTPRAPAQSTARGRHGARCVRLLTPASSVARSAFTTTTCRTPKVRSDAMTGTRATLAERLDRRSSVSETRSFNGTFCIEWDGYRNKAGYGEIGRGAAADGNVLTHIAAWELQFGPVPDGLELDHLCRNRACRNTLHLEAVTRRVNLLRSPLGAGGKAQQTACGRGHEFTEENTYRPPRRPTNRHCRQCARDRQAANT